MTIQRASNGSKAAARELVQIVGFGLGNLIYRVYTGSIKKASGREWSEPDRAKVRGTTNFVLGGSIGTIGYTRELLPLVARNRIKNTLFPGCEKLAASLNIFSPTIDAATAGALGTFFLALPEATRQEIRGRSQDIYNRGKLPILPLLDIGGTKIKFVLAHLDIDGQITYDILEDHVVATPKAVAPQEFYEILASMMMPVVSRFQHTAFEVIRILAVGQPGFFSDSKSPIGHGTARDLGTGFPGANPSELLTSAITRIASVDFDVHVANDGRAQFFGILNAVKTMDPLKWEALKGKKIVYLGLGTGLGAGYGAITAGGTIELFDLHNAFDVVADERWEVLPPARYCNNASLLDVPYEYGALLSGKFFERYVRMAELSREGAQPLFTSLTGLRHAPKAIVEAFLERTSVGSSPLNAVLINSTLDGEIVTSKTAELVELQRKALEYKLGDTLEAIAFELDRTMVANVRSPASQYVRAIEEVSLAKRRRRRVQFMGIGKSHSICGNLAYIFSNLGINSASIELTGADCENLTNLREDDVVFLISNSGRSAEILQLIPSIRKKRCVVIALTGDPDSPMARNCDIYINSHVEQNPHPIREAPTTSTTAALAAGTAIAMVVSYGFDYDAEDFYRDHPGLEAHSSGSPKFKGAMADSGFDPLTKIEDVFHKFAQAIRELAQEPGLADSMIALTTRILISHFNRRPVFFTGAGSSLRVAEKVASTLTSIGIDAAAVNPAQLPHGEFAQITPGDLLVMVSFSGETKHLLRMRDHARRKEVECAVITANAESTLARGSELCVIARSDLDDTHLVPVPDQKILSSFLNLTIGDALAVLLAVVLKRTESEFASQAHPGGAIGRTRSRLDRSFLRSLSRGRVEQLESPASAEEMRAISSDLGIRLDGKRLSLYLDRPFTCSGEGQEVMVFGMGGIGLSYLGPLCCALGKKITFVEKSEERVTAMRNNSYEYTVCPVDGAEDVSDCEAVVVSGISAMGLGETGAVVSLGLKVDVVFTAVGATNVTELAPIIVEIVKLRYAFWIEEPINFVFCENFSIEEDPLASFRQELRFRLGDPELEIYFDEFVGLVPAIDEAIVPDVRQEALSKPIAIEKDSPSLFIDRSSWKPRLDGRVPQWNRVVFTESFRSIHLRKLFLHNMAHATIGYLGYLRGYEKMYDAIMDPDIERIVTRNMMLIGHELYRRWGYDSTPQKTLAEYVNWLLGRYKNRPLGDTVNRVCRDPIRKLAPNDRLVGPVNYIVKYAERQAGSDAGDLTESLLMVVVAAMHYAVQEGAYTSDYEALKNHMLGQLSVDSRHLLRAEEQLADLLRSTTMQMIGSPAKMLH